MRGLFLAVLFPVVTVVCWGVYGPILEAGHLAMAHSDPDNADTTWVVLRPTIVTGIACAVVCLLTTGIVLSVRGDRGCWSLRGTFWGLAAGAAAALGTAATVAVFALGGRSIYAMPLIFGGVPIVATLMAAATARRMRQIGAPLLAGTIIVAIGWLLLVLFRPDAVIDGDPKRIGVASFLLVLVMLSAVLLCWGSYPSLRHRAETRMGGSLWRPTLCVGLAFVALAICASAFLLGVHNEPSQFTVHGTLVCLAAGAAVATGGLAIVAALSSGGKSIYLMPLVFAGAPLVNTFAVTARSTGVAGPSPGFLAGLILVITGSVMVLVFAPRGSRRKAKTERKQPPAAERPAERPAEASPGGPTERPAAASETEPLDPLGK